MADKKETEEEPTGKAEKEAGRGKKKGIVLGGGIVGLVATAYLLFMVAVPRAPGNLPFQGPFFIALTPEEGLQTNLAGEGKNYLIMKLSARYEAYDESYATARTADDLYKMDETHALVVLARHKTKAELDAPLGEESFSYEIRDVLNPLLFPIHVGNEESTYEQDGDSGLRPGDSTSRATMRTCFYSHVLKVDGPRGTIALDNGPAVQFDGSETDLLLESETGKTVYVDVTNHDPEFVGDVHVGTFGRITKIRFGDFKVQ